VSDVPTLELVEQLRRANAGLREVVTARDAESAELRAENAELRAVVHALGLQVAELQRRLGSGSDDSGTPTSKESIEAKARRKAERQARREQQDQEQEPEPRGGSSRQRSKDKPRGGQPGHPGHGLRREPNPNQQLTVAPPAECRGCGDDLSGAADAGTAWSQIWDVKILPWRIEYLLPRRRCACTVTTVAQPPAGGVVNSISFGPVLNTAAARVDRVR
jgi:transposase